MIFKTNSFIKYLLISTFFIIISCSKGFKKENVNLFFPRNIAKIEGSHALIIKNNIFNLKRNISSDDCESWALDLKLEKLFVDTYKQLSKKMFQNIKIFEGEINESFFKNNSHTSVLTLEKNIAYVDFKTEGNKGKFRIVLDSSFKVKGDKKEVNNNLNSKQTWEKNIFLNCNLSVGAKKATEEAFKNLISQAYSSIYESVFTVTKK